MCPSASIFTIVPGYSQPTPPPMDHQPTPPPMDHQPTPPPMDYQPTPPPMDHQPTLPPMDYQPTPPPMDHQPTPPPMDHQPTPPLDYQTTNRLSSLNHSPSFPANQPLICNQQSDLPIPLSLLFNPDITSSDNIDEKCYSIFQNLSITQGQANNLFTLTKQQSDSELWFQHRVGRITASHMHKVKNCKERKYPTSIVKSIFEV